MMKILVLPAALTLALLGSLAATAAERLPVPRPVLVAAQTQTQGKPVAPKAAAQAEAPKAAPKAVMQAAPAKAATCTDARQVCTPAATATGAKVPQTRQQAADQKAEVPPAAPRKVN